VVMLLLLLVVMVESYEWLCRREIPALGVPDPQWRGEPPTMRGYLGRRSSRRLEA
jgi:hypothetical protein